MLISYAQNFEDIILYRAFKHQKAGHYLDIGAWHPTRDSVTKLFYDLGWSGINIEPIERYYQLLVEERKRDINIKCLIGPISNQEVEMVDLGDNSNMHSYIAMPGEKVVKGLQLTPRVVKSQMMTLDDIVMSYGKRISFDFLKIDAEGAEAQIIMSTNWIAFRPRVMVIESVKPLTFEPCWHEWEPILFENNYDFAFFDGINRYYCSRENQHLIQALSIPANILDGFKITRDHAISS